MTSLPNSGYNTSLEEATNHEQIRQSSNPLAIASSSSSFHSTQGNGQLVVVGIKVLI